MKEIDKPTEDGKIERARQQREQQEHEKLVKDKANLIKWEFLREERHKYETYVNARERTRRMRTKWAKHVKTVLVLAKMVKVYNEIVEQVYLYKKRVWMANTTKEFWKQHS